MTGLIVKKYHVAVLDEDGSFLTRVITTLRMWYNNKVVVKTYANSRQMFEGISINKAKNCPFDAAVLSSKDAPISMVLKQTDPSLKILMCKDEQTFKMEVTKLPMI